MVLMRSAVPFNTHRPHLLQGLANLLSTYLPEYGNLITSHTSATNNSKA